MAASASSAVIGQSLSWLRWQIAIDSSGLESTGHIQVIVEDTINPGVTFHICQSQVRNVTYPNSCTSSRWNYLNSVIKYKSTDILIVTYPKCGTTWTEQTVLLMLNLAQGVALDPESKNTYRPGQNVIGKIWPEACVDQQSLKMLPGPEFQLLTLQEFEDAPSPRVIKSHAPLSLLLGTNGEGIDRLPSGIKVIVVARNPLDACVSSYYHAFNPHKSGWPFDGMYELFLICIFIGCVTYLYVSHH